MSQRAVPGEEFTCKVSSHLHLKSLEQAACGELQVLPGRTQNGVKNHWHATMRKVCRAPAYANPSTPLQAYLRELSSGNAQPPPGLQKGQELEGTEICSQILTKAAREAKFLGCLSSQCLVEESKKTKLPGPR